VDVAHTVTVDDSSKWTCDWIPYYKHHSDMDGRQYVHVDVTSD